MARTLSILGVMTFAAFNILLASDEKPQLVMITQGDVDSLSLLLRDEGEPQILWGDRKLHIAGVSPQGWQDLLSTELVSFTAPLGNYNQQGELYLVIQNIRPWRTLSLLKIPDASVSPQPLVEFQWTDSIYPKFLSPPTADHPLHLIFESKEWRFTPFWTGHFRTAFGKYFSMQWNGQRWTKPAQIVDRGRFDVTAIACDAGQPPQIACVWSDSRHGKDEQALFFAEYDGSRWSKNIALGDDYRFSLGVELAIVTEKDGAMSMVFAPLGGGIFLQERRGNKWGPVKQLATTGSDPMLSVDHQQRVHLVWREDTRILHRMKLDDQWSSPQVLVEAATRIEALTQLKVNADGQAHLAWKQATGRFHPIYGRADEVWYQSFRLDTPMARD